ncbi:hypothetical protein [Methanobrevibacter sp.]|uniref:hypothetical protein n=1 Tax=Methanobrevibacter sp. TaxID=66852 RepID=UPI003863F95B
MKYIKIEGARKFIKYSFKATPDDISAIAGTAISKTRIVIAIAKTPSVTAACLSVNLFKSPIFVINYK